MFLKKDVLKTFTIFTGSNCFGVSFWPATLLKRDSKTGVFLWICEIFNTFGGGFWHQINPWKRKEIHKKTESIPVKVQVHGSEFNLRRIPGTFPKLIFSKLSMATSEASTLMLLEIN